MRTSNRRSDLDRMWFRPPASRRDTEATVTAEASRHAQHYRGLFCSLILRIAAWPRVRRISHACLPHRTAAAAPSRLRSGWSTAWKHGPAGAKKSGTRLKEINDRHFGDTPPSRGLDIAHDMYVSQAEATEGAITPHHRSHGPVWTPRSWTSCSSALSIMVVISARCPAGPVARHIPSRARCLLLFAQHPQLSGHGGGLVFLARPPGVVGVFGWPASAAADADDSAHPGGRRAAVIGRGQPAPATCGPSARRAGGRQPVGGQSTSPSRCRACSHHRVTAACARTNTLAGSVAARTARRATRTHCCCAAATSGRARRSRCSSVWSASASRSHRPCRAHTRSHRGAYRTSRTAVPVRRAAHRRQPNAIGATTAPMRHTAPAASGRH
ncbi:hypothetical protein FB157_12017 [Streptomyces sp. BK340]|nr:hypothetical protein FB157_12017 [Streptomyces sp. BK340]